MRVRRTLAAKLVAGSCLVIGVMWLSSGMLAVAERVDPIPAFAVKLEIQGMPGTIFIKELTGIGSESEVIEQKVSGQPFVQSLPGRLKWKELVIKRGLTGDRSFWVWRGQVETGNLQGALRTFSITFMNSALTQPMARWEGTGGWPSKLIVSNPASSTSSELLMEELTIAHSGLVRTL
jgi:phage tail-like protein